VESSQIRIIAVMKKAARVLLVILSIIAISGPPLRAATKTLQEAITSSNWSWEYYEFGIMKSEKIGFYQDGTAKNYQYFTAHWEITGPRTLVLKMHDQKAVLKFTEDLSSYQGIDFRGKLKVWGYAHENVDPNRASPNRSKSSPSAGVASAASAPAKAGPTCIQILSEQAPNALEWALAPLDRKTPPEIRENLTLLRENLLDEAAKKPAANAETYRLGKELCNELIGTLDERDKMLVRAGYTAVLAKVNMGEITNQALEARRRFTNWPTYQREKDQRNEVRKQKQNGAALERQRPVLEWADRGAQIRRIVDGVYADYREAARQRITAK
jgi:hypothetical protein